jgi:hypothetical protein
MSFEFKIDVQICQLWFVNSHDYDPFDPQQAEPALLPLDLGPLGAVPLGDYSS